MEKESSSELGKADQEGDHLMEEMDLREAMRLTLIDVNEQIEAVKEKAIEFGCEPREVMMPDGTFAMVPLLEMKTKLLCALNDRRSQIINQMTTHTHHTLPR